MAKPIELMPVPRDAREETRQRVENAPVDHAAAVLSAFELLNELHKSGALDLLRGAVGAGGEIVKQATELAAKPESVRAMRNLLLLGQLLGSIDPDILHGIIGAFQAAAERRDEQKTPSIFRILRRLNSEDSRYALDAVTSVMESVGHGLNPRNR